jgi:hypothetical protein
VRAGRVREWLFVGAAIGIGLGGLALVLSAPLDGPARTGLGSGLITGLIVGVAVAAIQWTVESRRVAREAEEKERQHRTMYDVACSRLGTLVGAHMWTYWQLLLPYVNEPPTLLADEPPGYRDDDLRNVHRVLQWLREQMGGDLRWWQDATLLVTADALSFVTTDLLERIGFPDVLGEEWSPDDDLAIRSLSEARERAVERIAGIAERLADAGDIERAFALDTQVDAFVSNQPMTTYTPDLGVFRTSEGVTLIGKRALADVRTEVGWIVDQLRPDPVHVNEYGVPTSPGAPHPAEYRWGRLFGPEDDPATAWERRYAAGSWLRAIFERAERELPAMFGLDPAGAEA